MTDKDKLTQIVKRVQEDIGEFELLYTYIIDKVYFWCYTVMGNETDAKDVTQESMIKIHNSIQSLKEPEMFSSWMYRLVRNNCLNYIRLHKSKEYEFPQDENYKDSYENNIPEVRRDNIPHEAYDLKETKKIITSFIDNLPNMQREVITLYYLEEMKIGEISETLNYSLGTVKSTLYSGRKNLETKIKDFQVKNNVKLYSNIVLPMLGEILQEHSDTISSNQDLSYSNDFNSKQDLNTKKDIKNNQKLNSNQSIQNVSKLSKVAKLKSAVTLNVSTFTSMAAVVTATAIVATVAVVAAVVIAVQNNHDSEVINAISNEPKVNEVNFEEKLKGNPYIENIVYSTFPTRHSTPVVINLKKDISRDEITVVYKGEDVPFDKKDIAVTIIATENGEYTITINEEELDIYVSNIDEYAPEVESVQKKNDYLQLIINDEKSVINYDESYIEYRNEKYQITKDKQVLGDFSGDINIYIYNNHNQYISYEVNI